MRTIISIVCGSFLLALLNGCVMSREEAAAYYGGFSDQELCMSYLTADPINIYQSDRRAEINKRRLDCSPWSEMARLKYQQERAAWDAAYGIVGALGNSGGSTSYSSSGTSLSSGFTKVCYYDGMSGPSALTVLSTSICPLSHSHNISGMTKVCNYPNAMGGPKAITVSTMHGCPLNYDG